MPKLKNKNLSSIVIEKQNQKEMDKQKSREEWRQRKKQTIHAVREQLEFYFSAANLSKDLFMKNLLAESEYISLDIFKNFNKMKKLSTEPSIMKKAIKQSEILVLSQDEQGVRRKEPYEVKKDEIDCTIYVENIPDGVEHDWVRQQFLKYGEIDYIALPRNKYNKPRGFAFVEFKTSHEAHAAVMAYGNINMYAPGINPEDLCSVRTHELFVESDPSGKRNFTADDQTVISVDKKIKMDRDETETNLETTIKIESEQAEINPDKKVKIESEELAKKKRKKNKKKKKHKMGNMDAAYHLTVMSKRCWKRLRNTYLDLQRQNKQERRVYNAAMGYDNPHNFGESSTAVSKMPPYIAGVIVKVELDEPVINTKEFKKEMMQSDNIAFVDIQPDSYVMYVRFKSNADAIAFIQSDTYKNAELLKDNDESQYWDGIYSSWMRLHAKNNKNKNQEIPSTSGSEPKY